MEYPSAAITFFAEALHCADPKAAEKQRLLCRLGKTNAAETDQFKITALRSMAKVLRSASLKNCSSSATLL